MTGKKFAIIESSMILALIGIFAANILLNQTKENDNETHISMSFINPTTFEDLNYQEDYTHNVWLDMIEETYNFKPIIDTAVGSSSYEEKLNIAIGSNDLSDIFSVNINQFTSVNKANQIYDDLTAIYDEYASDELKEAMGWDEELKQNSNTFKKWVVDGKLKAIPSKTYLYANTPVLFIRKDWLDIIGYDTPKTIDDMERILIKFKEKGLGKGLAANNELLFTNAGSFDFVFNAYGSYPTLFKYDSNNKVQFGFMGQETKDALERLQYWYSQGLIYTQFAQTKPANLTEKVKSGDIGVIYGDMSLPLSYCAECVLNNPGADFVACPAPDLDKNTMTRPGVKSTGSEAFVVRANYSHPERLIQMLNLYYEKLYSERGDFDRFNKIKEAYPTVMEPFDKNYFRTKEIQSTIDLDKNTPAFNDLSIDLDSLSNAELEDLGLHYKEIPPESRNCYKYVRRYLNGDIDPDSYGMTRVFYAFEDENGKTMQNGKKGYDSSFSAIDKYANNDLAVLSVYDGVDTESFSKNRRTIETKITETMINIIKGSPVSLLDTTIRQIKNWTDPVLAEIEIELNK